MIAPLQLGTIGEAHFVLDRHWRDHFERMHGAHPGPRTVERLRAWTDQPVRMLLDDEVLSLVVSTYAVDHDLVMTLDGMTLQPAIQKLEPRVELVAVELPTTGEWQTAGERAPAIFGVQASPVLSAANVAQLAGAVREVAEEHRDAAHRLVQQLGVLSVRFGVASDADRRRTADAAVTLLDGITSASSDLEVVKFLAGAQVPTTATALGASIKQADRVAGAIASANLDLFANAFELTGEFAGEARTIRDRLVRDAEYDQHSRDLVATLQEVNRDVTNLFAKITQAKQPESQTKSEEPLADPPAGRSPREQRLPVDQARQLLDELAERNVSEVIIRWEEG